MTESKNLTEITFPSDFELEIGEMTVK